MMTPEQMRAAPVRAQDYRAPQGLAALDGYYSICRRWPLDIAIYLTSFYRATTQDAKHQLSLLIGERCRDDLLHRAELCGPEPSLFQEP